MPVNNRYIVIAEPDSFWGASITGVSFVQAWATRVEVERGGLTLPFIGRACLVQNKRATGRDKDLVDVRLLTA